MHFSTALLTLVTASVAAAANAPIGFNYGNMKGNGYEPKVEADYVKEFNAAQALAGTDGKFNSARLYTMIQAGSQDDPNEAIAAAIKTKTRLLLGMWTSGPEENFKKELSALEKAIEKHGKEFTELIDGMSVGSEDLYRISPIGILNKSDVGIGPELLVKFIKQTREVFAKSNDPALKAVKVGHVDTWTAFTNSSNQAVMDNCDFLGVDAYPYWQAQMSNDITEAGRLFWEAIEKTEKMAGKAEVWITETGWPVKGPKSGLATADVESASKFFDGVGCEIMKKQYPTWWYILEENGAKVDFSVADKQFKPLYDLSCKNADKADKLMAGGDDKNSTDSDAKSTGGSGSGSSASETGGSGSGTSGDSQAASTAGASAAASGTAVDANNGSSSVRAASGLFAVAVAAVAAFMI